MKKAVKNKTSKVNASQSTHPWRLCAPGRHWVREHTMHLPPNKKNPGGSTTIRHAHCADNPTGKDQLYPDEMQEMGKQNFSNVQQKPCSIDLGFNKKFMGNQYDDLIAGWTKYWNDIFKPEIPLDPNIVKALIASESGFDPKRLADQKDEDSARGLMQVTNKTRKILADEKGELKDHYLTLTREDLIDPSNNICAGTRWLFRKRAIASNLLGRPATWEEAIEEFKGTRTTTKARAKRLMAKFNEYMERLKKCEKL